MVRVGWSSSTERAQRDGSGGRRIGSGERSSANRTGRENPLPALCFSVTVLAWQAFLASAFALPMSEAQLAIYRRHTGRATPPTTPCRELWTIAGRGAGKDRLASLVAVWLAAFKPYHVAPGERPTVALIAADRQQARVLFRYVVALVEIPLLATMVTKQTRGAIELSNGVVVEVHTCSFRSLRGYSFAAVVCDELAFWRDESSANPDEEVLTAVRPGLAKIPGSILVCISSPYARRGALWNAYKRHYGKDTDGVLVWQAATAEMNPTVDPAVIAAAYE